MDMISSASSVASPHHHNHQHENEHQHQQDAMGTAVASPQVKEARNAKQAWQQQQQAVAGDGERKPRPTHDHALKCPRCESTNTKFCYYNNYSLLQPRYYCKACRRYWTQGGSLRNVPVGGGCRKNKRSSNASASSGSSSSSSKIDMQLVPRPPMVPASTTDIPNVLPTFMSTGFELPRNHNFLLPFTPLSVSNPPPVLAPGAGTMTSFLDILRGGFLDGSSNHQSNSFYSPTTNGMAMPLPPSFGFGVMQHQHGVGEHAVEIGGGATAATTQGEGQWPTTALQHGTNNGDVEAGSAAGLQQVDDDGAHQQLGSSNDVMMESGSSTSRDCYWNNNNGGVPNTRSSPAAWQGGLINNSSLI